MSRFFVEPRVIGDSNILIDDKENIHHISKVLRLKEGAEIEISDGGKWEYKCEIISIDKGVIDTKILDKQSFGKEPNLKITLFQGIPKQSKMDLIVQKTTELGVSNVYPVFMNRTVVSDKGNFQKKISRYQAIAEEASKQCGRGVVPSIEKNITFNDMIELLNNYDLVLFPYENEDKKNIKNILRTLVKKPATVAVIIGPEGGFSDSEAEILKQRDVQCVTLGKTILRTETAGIVAIAMIMYELELE